MVEEEQGSDRLHTVSQGQTSSQNSNEEAQSFLRILAERKQSMFVVCNFNLDVFLNSS